MSRLERLAKDNNYTDFEAEYLRTYRTATAADASASFNAHRLVSKTNNSNSNFNGLSGLATSSIKEENLSGGLGDTFKFVKLLGSNIKTMLSDPIEGFKNIATTLVNEAESFATTYNERSVKLYESVNEKIGMSGDLARDFRDEIMNANPYAETLGISFEDLNQSVTDLVNNSGKFKILDTQTINNMSFASKFVEGGIKGFTELASLAEKYSIGVNDTANYVTSLMKNSIDLGLNYKKVIGDVKNSLDKISQYGFKNGIDGLGKMSQKAIEYRMNLDSVFSIADKVWDPEGALELTANIQMLGGAVGDLNDPLKLMYMATNDVEGLQESLLGAAKGLATYNEEQGVFEIKGANLRRAKEMAKSLNIEYKDLYNSAISSQERISANNELLSSGLQMDDDDREFLTNMSRMEGGKMVISIPENLQEKFKGIEKGQLDLSSMTSEQLNTLKEYRDQIKEMSPEEIQKSQVNLLTQLNRNVSAIKSRLINEVGKTGSKLIQDEALKLLGTTSDKFKKDVTEKSAELSDTIHTLGKSTRSTIDDIGKKGNEIIRSFYKQILGINGNNNVTTQNKNDFKKQEEYKSKMHGNNVDQINLNYKFTADSAILDPIKRGIEQHYNMNKNSYLYIPKQ